MDRNARVPVIGIMHQYAYTRSGRPFIPAVNWNPNDNKALTNSVKVPGGLQRIPHHGWVCCSINVKERLALHLRCGPIH
jgi:hypothetical protein